MKSHHNLDMFFTTVVVMISAMGGFLFGYDWIVIGGAQPFYEPFFGLTESAFLQVFTLSSTVIGSMIGAVFAGMIAAKYGRKRPLVLSAVLFTLSSLGTGMADSYSVFIIYRLIGGFATAIAMLISPIYIAELSPAPLRGRFVVINQLTIVLGIFLARLVNIYIAKEGLVDGTSEEILNSWGVQVAWRWMFWVESIFSVIFFLFILGIPESPRWLLREGKTERAMVVLRRFGGDEYAKAFISDIPDSFKEDGEHESVDWSFLRKPKTKAIVVIGVIFAVFQQLCGINVIFDFSEEIFNAAGYGDGDIMFNLKVVGIVNVVFTLVALKMIDTLGRRKLMLIGYGILSILFLFLGSFYYMEYTGIIMLVCVLVGIGVYAMTIGPATWVVLSEIFPSRVRAIAMSVATFGLWTSGFLVTYSFPYITEALGTSGTFWGYAVICMLAYVFVQEYMPETKGKSLEQIETLFDKYEDKYDEDI